jgi:hypothetical protein
MAKMPFSVSQEKSSGHCHSDRPERGRHLHHSPSHANDPGRFHRGCQGGRRQRTAHLVQIVMPMLAPSLTVAGVLTFNLSWKQGGIGLRNDTALPFLYDVSEILYRRCSYCRIGIEDVSER